MIKCFAFASVLTPSNYLQWREYLMTGKNSRLVLLFFLCEKILYGTIVLDDEFRRDKHWSYNWKAGLKYLCQSCEISTFQPPVIIKFSSSQICYGKYSAFKQTLKTWHELYALLHLGFTLQNPRIDYKLTQIINKKTNQTGGTITDA